MNDNWIQKIPVSIWLFSIAAVAVTLALIEIVDVFQLPYIESFLNSGTQVSLFSSLVKLLTPWGYIGLFALMFLESMALPIPSELVLPFAGYLIFSGRMTFPEALGVSTAASLLGSLAIYILGIKLSPPLIYALATKLGISQTRLAKLEMWFTGKYGSTFVFVARFIPGIRSSISFPAGVMRMKLSRFIATTLAGSFGWSLLLMYLGYSAGLAWQSSPVVISNFLIKVAPFAVVALSTLYISYFLLSTARTRGVGTWFLNRAA